MTFKDEIKALLNSESKVNIIKQAFVFQLGLKIWKTNIEVQKINGTTLEIYKIIVFTFFILNKYGH